MTDIFVSDLFGYNINNETPFVIINSKEAYKYLKKIAHEKKSSIWEYNRARVNDVLKMRNVDPNQFVPLGHVFYNKYKNITTLILANKSICQYPTNFEEVATYGDGKVFRPVSENLNYAALGLVFVKNGNKPANNICLLPNDLVSPSGQMDNFHANDFFLLSHTVTNTIKKSKLFNNNHRDMKLTSTSNKYITAIDNAAKLKEKQYSKRQLLSYNVKGELIADGKCLTYHDENSPLYFSGCSNDKKQQWDLFAGKISPQHENNKCVTPQNGEMYIKPCQDVDEQNWMVEESDVENTSDYKWNKYHGKTVVLVESDNPWYINKDTTVQMDYQKRPAKLQHNLDPMKEYGDLRIEKFETNESLTDNKIIYILLSILLIIILYRIRYSS